MYMLNRNSKANFLVTKASGEVVPFSEEKLKHSLIKAGASDETAIGIIELLKPKLFSGVSTKKIYRWAFNLLRSASRPMAAKYYLKKAIMELGPSGFPFERFVAEILKYKGYTTRVGETVAGKCVRHEIDVIAEKEDSVFMIECKFHIREGTMCDVKVPLYIHSRFKDVEFEWLKNPVNKAKVLKGWLVTNTKFSVDAVKYGLCSGLNLLGWNFPEHQGLKNQIDEMGLYPVTCLTSLTKSEKQALLNRNIVLCKDLLYQEKILQDAGVRNVRIKTVMSELEQIAGK